MEVTANINFSSYLVLEDFARLENLSYDSLKKRIQRNPEAFKCVVIANMNGGAPRKLIHIGSLSSEARLKHVKEFIEPNTEEEPLMDLDNPPWYVTTEPFYYQTNYDKYYYDGKVRLKVIEEYLEYPGNKQDLMPLIKAKLNISQSAFMTIKRKYAEALQWANYLEAETGYCQRDILILALGRQPRVDKGSVRLLTSDHKTIIENIYFAKTYQENRQSVMTLYRKYSKEVMDRGLIPLAYETIRKHVDTLDKGAAYKLAHGKNRFEASFVPKARRDTKSLMALDFIEGDAHTMDFYVKKRAWNGEWVTFRPKMIAWLDLKTRTLLGWYLCEDPGAAEVAQSFIQVIYPKKNEKLPYGLPREILIDNGREFKNKFTKGLRSFPNANESSDFEEVMDGFYKNIGVETIHHSRARCPWSKGCIERFFGTLEEQFGKEQPSYTGTLSGSSTDNKVQKDISKIHLDLIPTLEELNAQLETYITEEYHMNLHDGLRSIGEKSYKPFDLWNVSDRYFKAPLPLESAIRLISDSKKMSIRKQGLIRKISGESFIYSHPELMTRIGEKVQVFFNPLDLSQVDVYGLDGKKLCTASNIELVKLGYQVDEDQLADMMRNKKRIRDLAGKQIEYGRLNKKDRDKYDSYINFDLEHAGKRSAAPELSEKVAGTTALPTGKRDRADRRFEKEQRLKEDERRIPELFEKRGRQVYERMMKQAK